ncbi:MAG: hypothetical protein COW13_04540, partial [Candidatus Omnitrophica bacterium CG12_big_fil_rev_8_21_14_0_65_50_5]
MAVLRDFRGCLDICQLGVYTLYVNNYILNRQFGGTMRTLIKLLSLWIAVIFTFETIFSNNVLAQTISLPGIASSVGLSESIQPVMIRGMKLNPENGLNISFIIDSGSTVVDEAELQKESEKLIKYFLAALTIPEKD